MNAIDNTTSAIVHDKPVPSRPGESFWGSDAVALMLRELDIPYIALVPGASYRGLHDSIVNLLGNRSPQMVLCVHEETAVGISHGYAKVTDKMMASGLHANIGMMRAIMSVYNAWCDRAPILILGATGPWDATQRRPWIDWIHTTADQGGLIRNFTKWDNQPGSPGAAVEALMRASQIAQTAPKGPTYINLEVGMQEGKIGPMPTLPDPKRNAPPKSPQPSAELVAEAARLLSNAKNPVILAGRCSRSVAGWNARVALAEKLNAPVFTFVKLAAAFPTDHRLHAAPPGSYLTDEGRAMVREARTPETVTHENAERRLVVQCNVRGRDVGSFVAEAQQRLAGTVTIPAGYYITWGGQFENQQRAMTRLSIVLPLSLAIIFILLFTTFGKVRWALLILVNVPFALVGGVAAIWLRGLTLNLSAAVGFIALFGVAVLNGVVMIAAIRALRDEDGLPLHQATLTGAGSRLKPVLMTALVASIGFLPMALSHGSGAEVQRPLATVVIGGIVTSTLLTLIVLPTLYEMMEEWVSRRADART